MKLVVDTDAFCKLGAAGLLAETAGLFGATLGECGRLAALPHMLRRGRLRETLGASASEFLLEVATELPTIPEPSVASLDQFTPIDAIDPGEAQLFAVVSELSIPLVTADKRAMRALATIPDIAQAMNGRIVCIEAVLLELCERMSLSLLHTKMSSVRRLDQMMKACFSCPEADPRDCLDSYRRQLSKDVEPIVLWRSEGR